MYFIQSPNQISPKFKNLQYLQTFIKFQNIKTVKILKKGTYAESVKDTFYFE